MRTILILFSAVILIKFADAQRKSNITKPVVNLDKRPRPPVWNRPPEERRKLSIFPKTSMKFIVTPKPVVKNDNAAKEGLPTKRPIMRKFIIQDKNEEGTWSFAPRESLMKINRFTVTLAPPKFNHKTIDEIRPEESKKVNTVISKPKMEQGINKAHNLNEGNFIEITNIKKADPPASENIKHLEEKFIVDDILETSNGNETQNFDIIKMNDNPTPVSDKVLENYSIDVRTLNDDDVILNANETNKNTYQNEQGDVESNQTVVSNTEQPLDFFESRAVDLKEIKYSIDQNERNSLTMNDEESNDHNPAQILSFNDLEILLEKIVNNTETSNDNSQSNEYISPKNKTKILKEDIPKFDYTKPNKFYDIISVGKDEDNNTNFQEGFLTGSEIQDSQNMATDAMHSASETNGLDDKQDFTENVADSLLVGNLESLMKLIDKETIGFQNHEIIKDQREIVAENEQEIKIEDMFTDKLSINNPSNDSNFTNGTDYESQTEFPKGSNSNDSQELSLDLYESNTPLNTEEVSAELLNEEKDEVLDKSMMENFNLTLEEASDEVLTVKNTITVATDEISYESIGNSSNSYSEERANESLTDTSNNFTNEEISSESSSNIDGKELSNESNPDQSNSLTDEIYNESGISLNNFTSDEISNESSSNMAGEEISNESYPDQSNNLTEEMSNESITEITHSFIVEEVSNESSSNMSREEISNESYADKSNNLTEEISNEYTIETSNNLTAEEISNESSSNMAGEEISHESYLEKSNSSTQEKLEIADNSTGEIPDESSIDISDIVIDKRISDEPVESSQDSQIAEEALINRFKRSNNIIEEENLPTTVSGFKYTGHEVRLNHDLSYKNINA